MFQSFKKKTNVSVCYVHDWSYLQFVNSSLFNMFWSLSGKRYTVNVIVVLRILKQYDS